MPDEDMMFATESRMATVETEVEEQTEKFLIFESDGLLFGAPVEYVVEIITHHTVTCLPKVPNYVAGVINLRGQIIPIIDIRLRLGKERREDCYIIVLDVEGMQIGILVDAVDQMIDLPSSAVLPMPGNTAQKLVSGLCSLPKGGTMMVLDCAQLLET